MFKGEYQGGPFVDVFSAQGRDPLSKKCKVTGTSSSVQKQYDKDVKSYVYVLEGEPTTTKIQFPKEDKHGLFLTQKFLVFQLFVPIGRPFSFEIAVTDQTQNKRRIFFSSNLKDISVTPLHAKFPLTSLNAGSWLNMYLDLESLVSDTFSGPKFRAVESFTITANCRLKKVFTLRAPPLETSDEDRIQYANTEPLPRSLQLVTTSEVSTSTQVLSYMKLCGNGGPSTPVSTPSGHEGTTPRQDVETHIAFGTKVVIPPHLRRNSFKENREASKIPQNARLSASKSKQSDVHYTNDGLVLNSPLSPKENEDSPRGIDANQASIQPRPPRTSSAGKIRRPLRLKPSSAGKTRNADSTNEKPPESLETEKNSLSAAKQNNTKEKSIEVLGNSDPSEVMETENSEVAYGEGSVSRIPHEELGNALNGSSCRKNADSVELDEKMKMVDINALRKSSATQKVTERQRLENGKETDPTTKTSIKNSEDGKLSLNGFTNGHGEIHEENSLEKAEQKANNAESDRPESNSNIDSSVRKSTHKQSLDFITSDTKNLDVNNNESSTNKDSEQPRMRPRKLPLASNNPVFTFASVPRSPRSGKRKLLESPMVDGIITPSVEVAPVVMVSLAETPVKNGNRGASLEDDFCKLSDDEKYDDDDDDGGGDGIQKLLHSSLSPRHSPMPFHQQLRQSIRSSMLKEIPSPVKENGYDAQNYQSDHGFDTLNQSTASSWRFDTSDSSNSFNQTRQDLEDSLNDTKALRQIAAVADIPMVDDDEDALSDCSDDTSCSTWRTPPQELRGNKYQNEMKPLGEEPDLTATICVNDPREYCDVFSPPIILGTPNKENNRAISNLSPMKSPNKFPCGANEEEELDLLYDPCLNCYFDPKTHKYYELA